jgi:hypothetical protein
MFFTYLVARVVQTPRYRRMMAACLLIACSLLLVRSNAIWRAAGDLAESIVEGLAGFGDQGALFVVNLPDNLRGAYVFRNGFASALALFYGDGGYRDVTVISRHDIGAPSDGVSIVRTSHDTYHIELSNSSVSFVHLNASDGESPSQYYELDNVTTGSYDLTFKPSAPQERRLLYYSAGNVVAY